MIEEKRPYSEYAFIWCCRIRIRFSFFFQIRLEPDPQSSLHDIWVFWCRDAENERKKQEEALRRFRMRESNILVSSSVLGAQLSTAFASSITVQCTFGPSNSYQLKYFKYYLRTYVVYQISLLTFFPQMSCLCSVALLTLVTIVFCILLTIFSEFRGGNRLCEVQPGHPVRHPDLLQQIYSQQGQKAR